MWQVWHSLHVAKALAGVEKTEAFWKLCLWQVQYLVNLDDVLKGSKKALCEAIVGSIWNMILIPCGKRLGLILSYFPWLGQYVVDLDKKVAEAWVQ